MENSTERTKLKSLSHITHRSYERVDLIDSRFDSLRQLKSKFVEEFMLVHTLLSLVV